jgi:hypothetical protein
LAQYHLPNWLRPLPYQMPGIPGKNGVVHLDKAVDLPWLKYAYVLLYEVVPPQSDEEAQLRQAQYALGHGTPEATKTGESLLQDLLDKHPDYLPARIAVALYRKDSGQVNGLTVDRQMLNAQLNRATTLAFEDRVDLDLVLGTFRDPSAYRGEILACLDQANEKNLRHLLPQRLAEFLQLVQSLQVPGQPALSPAEENIMRLGFSLLPPAQQAQVVAARAKVSANPPVTAPAQATGSVK